MGKSNRSLSATIKLLEKAIASKTKTAKVGKIRKAKLKLALALKQAKGPGPDDND